MRIGTFSHILYVCPTSVALQCSPHPLVNLSIFINVLWERALNLEYSIVQVKIEEKTFNCLIFKTLLSILKITGR